MAQRKSEDRKSWEKEQRRSRITDIAQEVFFRQGLDGATMEEIAREAGYNKRTIYLYFRDKEELFLAVVLRGQKILIQHLSAAFDQSKDHPALIRELGRAFFRFSIEHSNYFNLIMIYESRSRDYYGGEENAEEESFRSLCSEASDEYGRFIVEAIELGKSSNAIKTDLTSQQMMLLLWGQVFGVMQIILMRQDHFKEAYGLTPEDLYNHFLVFMEKALGN